jgi:hypothetical protein
LLIETSNTKFDGCNKITASGFSSATEMYIPRLILAVEVML